MERPARWMCPGVVSCSLPTTPQRNSLNPECLRGVLEGHCQLLLTPHLSSLIPPLRSAAKGTSLPWEAEHPRDPASLVSQGLVVSLEISSHETTNAKCFQSK